MGFMNLFGSSAKEGEGITEKGGELQQNSGHSEDADIDISKLSPLQRKQLKARNALKKLQTPPEEAGSQWTKEHDRVLSENVRLLIDSTSDEIEEHDEDDEADGDDYGDEDDGDEEDNGDGADEKLSQEGQNGNDAEIIDLEADESQAQTQATETPSAAASASTPRKKRSHAESASNEETGKPDKPPSKKPKFKSAITQHVLEQFQVLKPQPLQLTFTPHPAEDRSDRWYIEQFRRLYRRVTGFAHAYFGLHDIDEGEFHQPWTAGMSEEFISYVEDVAEADPLDGGWDTLLRNTKQREWLIAGIIMRILEIQVFGKDLWGATETELDLLYGLDRAFLEREGFERTALRSSTVRTIIGRGVITKNFHIEVAELTAQVSLLLQPLTFFLYSRPPKEGGANVELEAQYQELHNIIAIAAYLSICIRLSPTIFHFSNVSPNTPYNHAEQHSLDAEGYTRSKENAFRLYRLARDAHDKKSTELQDLLEKATGAKNLNRAMKKIDQAFKEHDATPTPRDPQLSHTALTKIGVWPNISRFKPGHSDDDEANIPLEERRGCRIFEISKSAVVSYYGLANDAERAVWKVRLGEFVETKMETYAAKEEAEENALAKRVMFIASMAMTVAIPYYLYAWPDYCPA